PKSGQTGRQFVKSALCQKRTYAVRQIARGCECSGPLPILVSYNKKSIRHPADAMSSAPIMKMSSSTPTILMRFPGIAPLGGWGPSGGLRGERFHLAGREDVTAITFWRFAGSERRRKRRRSLRAGDGNGPLGGNHPEKHKQRHCGQTDK